MTDMEPTGFEALVIYRLDKLEQRFDKLDDSVVGVRLDVVGLKIRSGIWGGLGGLIPSALAVALVVMGIGGGGGG